MKAAYLLIGMLMLSSAALAQQNPPPELGAPPPPEGRGGGGPGPGGGRPDGPGPRMRPGMDGGGSEGRDGMGRGDGGEDPRMQRLNVMRGYLDAVDRYARLAHDPAMSGIAAVVTAAD